MKLIDDRIANPAFALLLVTGAVMVFASGLPLTTLWIELAVALYLVLLVGGLFGYTPALRSQIGAVERGAPQPAYRVLASRARTIGIVLAVDTLPIVFLMVVKPASRQIKTAARAPRASRGSAGGTVPS